MPSASARKNQTIKNHYDYRPEDTGTQGGLPEKERRELHQRRARRKARLGADPLIRLRLLGRHAIAKGRRRPAPHSIQPRKGHDRRHEHSFQGEDSPDPGRIVHRQQGRERGNGHVRRHEALCRAED